MLHTYFLEVYIYYISSKKLRNKKKNIFMFQLFAISYAVTRKYLNLLNHKH
jgi:hypothetical protein